MKRDRRLLALVALSLLLHVIVIAIVARHKTAPPPAPLAPALLTLRLQPVRDNAVPAMAPAVQPAPAPPRPIAPAPSPPPVLDDPVPPAAPATVAAPPVAVADVDEPFQAPSRYRVRMPPSATLDYAVTQPDGTQTAAQIAWRTDNSGYTLAVDGVMGRLTSTGGTGDTGVEPKQSLLRGPGGAEVAATFAPGEIVIGGRPYRTGIGGQDPASLLLQLTGMGLAAPAQLHDVVAVSVATPDGPLAMRFQVTENEALATPLGSIATHHLVQLVRPGQARLDVWLAPQRGWLPVQLRLTAPDGTVSTQTITAIAD